MSQPQRVRIYICEPGDGAFHRPLGIAEVCDGKVVELAVTERNAACLIDVFNKLRIELAARSLSNSALAEQALNPGNPEG